MPLTKQQKEQRVVSLQEEVAGATSIVFMAFNGLTMEETEELRDQLGEEGSRMRVMPKRLLNIVMESAKIDFKPKEHDGQIAVVWGSDAVAPAKVLHGFVNERDHLKLVAGTLEGEMLTADDVSSLAQLPSKQELYGQLASVLAGPTRGFVQVLSGIPRSAVYVLQAIADKKS